MNRRDFLRLGGFSAAATIPVFLQKTAAASISQEAAARRKSLVVLQLSGGNDGLSTVVPFADAEYGRARSTTRIGENSVLRVNDRVGLHPNLKELREILDSGELAILQGASYPNPTRSHFEAMDVWHSADRGGARRGSGWIGRALDATCGNRNTPLLAVHLGGSVPLALRGSKSKPVTFQNPISYQWRGTRAERQAFGELNAAGSEMRNETGSLSSLDYLRRVAVDASASSGVIRNATQAYRARVAYPPGNRFAEDLRLVAAMIAARLETKVYYVSLGGFDTHANQRATHDNLMRTFSTAVAAFWRDLHAQELHNQVLLMSFSEFGRRVVENGSKGTDHGVAGPMFFVGSKLQPGLLGEHPNLQKLLDGDLAMTTDFRQAYAAVLESWLETSSEHVLGGRWKPIDLFARGEALRAF